MDFWQLLFLALIQGITEFLPVSSSAHLILPAHLSNWPDQGLAFDVAVHLGSLCAVMAYFRRDLVEFGISGMRLLSGKGVDQHSRLLFQVVVATIPAVIFGFTFKELVATEWRSLAVIATTTAAFGILLYVADRTKQSRIRSEFDLSWLIVCLIGLAQAIAIIPGTSRSGITITMALFLGVAPAAAARFSFLLSIPTISGAALLLGLDAYLDAAEGEAANNWTDLFSGFVLSGIAAYLGIHYFIALLERTGMTPYVIYRLVLAAALAFLLL